MAEIKYPTNRNEVEIQSDLYRDLRAAGIDIRLEVAQPKSSHARFDAVIFIDEKAVCIIECKSNLIHELGSQDRKRLNTQVEKYKQIFGLPVLVCGNSSMDTVRTVVQVKKLISQTALEVKLDRG